MIPTRSFPRYRPDAIVGRLTAAALWTRRALVGTGLLAGGHVIALPAVHTPVPPLLAAAVWLGGRHAPRALARLMAAPSMTRRAA